MKTMKKAVWLILLLMISTVFLSCAPEYVREENTLDYRELTGLLRAGYDYLNSEEMSEIIEITDREDVSFGAYSMTLHELAPGVKERLLGEFLDYNKTTGDAVVKLRPLGYSLYYSFIFGGFVVTDCRIENVVEKLEGVSVKNGDVIQIVQFSDWKRDDSPLSELFGEFLDSVEKSHGIEHDDLVVRSREIEGEFRMTWDKEILKKITVVPERWDSKKSEATRSSFKAIEGNFLCDTLSYYAVLKKDYKNPINYFSYGKFSTIEPWSIFQYCTENGADLTTTPGSEVQQYSRYLLDSSKELYDRIKSGEKILSEN